MNVWNLRRFKVSLFALVVVIALIAVTVGVFVRAVATRSEYDGRGSSAFTYDGGTLIAAGSGKTGARAAGASGKIILSYRTSATSMASTTRLTFTKSGTFTAPLGVKSVDIEMWGAGRGGAYVHETNVAVTPNHNYTVTIDMAQ